MNSDLSTSSFYKLSADHVLASVENALDRKEMGRRATGSIFALNSLENRVYQIDFEDGFKVVTKFYRPNRWSLDQLKEEHQFLQRLLNAEIPVVAPLPLPGVSNETVATSSEGIHFTIFPLVKGRLIDELSTSQLQTLGRYLGRLHGIGKTVKKSVRPRLDVNTFGWDSLKILMEADIFETEALEIQYQEAAERVLEKMEPLFERAKFISLHGDCHLGNTLWQGEAPFFLDFDDLCIAPAVQDIWMIVRGRDEQAVKDREILIQSYEQMNEFDFNELKLIEPLRALRIIHYSAWICQRWDDPSFPQAFPDFASTQYWRDEMAELQKIEESF